MKAREIISSAVLGPEALQVIRKAFDDAWADISQHFGHDERTIERARLRLAHAILAVADDDSTDPEAVKRNALQVMALTTPQLLDLRLPKPSA